MEDIVILDTMALINLLERCETWDLLAYFEQLGVKFKIVDVVMDEYQKGQKEPGISRMKKYLATGLIEVITKDIEIVNITNIKQLKGLHEGELISTLYFLENKDRYKFISDEKLVHKRLEENFGIKCYWITYLLRRLISSNFINAKDAENIYAEIKRNGFYGLKKISFSHE